MAPSRFVNPTSFAYCREITRDEIRIVIDQFGAAAQVAIDAGFDAVELHFGHLYLPSSFLSPLASTDARIDYGGSIDNRSRLVREIAVRVREVVGTQIAVIAKLNMDDGLPGSIWLDEALRTAQLLDADRTLDAIELTQGSSVYKPMYLFRGDVPVREFARVMPPLCARASARRQERDGQLSLPDMYMLDAARQFVPVVTNTKLILLGGITNRDHLETGLREGFDFVAMGRALLREPDLVNKMIADPEMRSRCNHNNKCMVTVFERTHCVLAPDQNYGTATPIQAQHDTALTPEAGH